MALTSEQRHMIKLNSMQKMVRIMPSNKLKVSIWTHFTKCQQGRIVRHKSARKGNHLKANQTSMKQSCSKLRPLRVLAK